MYFIKQRKSVYKHLVLFPGEQLTSGTIATRLQGFFVVVVVVFSFVCVPISEPLIHLKGLFICVLQLYPFIE